MARLYVGIDAGGSGTRAALARADGEVLGVGLGGPSNHLSGEAGRRRLYSAFAAALEPLLPLVGNNECVVHAGVTGISIPGKRDVVVESISTLLPRSLVHVTHDASAAVVGALAVARASAFWPARARSHWRGRRMAERHAPAGTAIFSATKERRSASPARRWPRLCVLWMDAVRPRVLLRCLVGTSALTTSADYRAGCTPRAIRLSVWLPSRPWSPPPRSRATGSHSRYSSRPAKHWRTFGPPRRDCSGPLPCQTGPVSQSVEECGAPAPFCATRSSAHSADNCRIRE